MTPTLRLVPTRWRRRAEQTLRDARFLWSSLTRPVPPVLVRDRAARSPRPAATGPFEVRVTSRRRETPDAVVLELTPVGAEAPTSWLPGQFLTVEIDRGGERVRRCYSLCVPPGERPWTIAAKRIPGGRVSPWLVDEVREGQTLRVHPPAGRFTVRTDPARARRLVAVAGGSGITPVVAILEAVLADEPRSRVALVDGNRRWEDVLFRERLAALAGDDRMALRHVLEEAPEAWDGGRGRLEPGVLARELDAAERALGDEGEPVEYFLCGPPGMRESAREVLRQRGVPPERTHEERFSRPAVERATIPREARPATLRVDGREAEVIVAPGQTLLEAGLEAGLPMPFTCAMGGCGACRCRLHEGEVTMEETSVLSDEERADGWILACVSRPLTPVVVEVEA